MLIGRIGKSSHSSRRGYVGVCRFVRPNAKRGIKILLTHPLARGLDIDDPSTVIVRRKIVRQKEFLRADLPEWYERIAGSASRQ